MDLNETFKNELSTPDLVSIWSQSNSIWPQQLINWLKLCKFCRPRTFDVVTDEDDLAAFVEGDL